MGKRKTPVVRMYHIRYVADLLVPATRPQDAFERADEEMIRMVEGDEMDLDDIFNITAETEIFHVILEAGEEDEEDDGCDCDDDECDCDDDDSDDDSDDDDDNGSDDNDDDEDDE